MEELKPCLKCNGKVTVDTGGFGPVGEDETIKVTFFDCADCGLTFSIPKPRVQAIKEFNTRPSPWIKITPETMPEVDEEHEDYSIDVFVKGFDNLGDEVTSIGWWNFKEKKWEDGCDNIVSFTHYMPIPPIPEEN